MTKTMAASTPVEAAAAPFGVYWELVSREGVVGHGFARGKPNELPERPGCSYHVWSLSPMGEMTECKSLTSRIFDAGPSGLPEPNKGQDSTNHLCTAPCVCRGR